MICHVALCSPPYATLSYLSPEEFPGFPWQAGMRVAVPLGNGAIRAGVIIAVSGEGQKSAEVFSGQHAMPQKEGITLRPLTWPLEKTPLLPADYMDTVAQLAARQYSSPGRILGNLLCSGIITLIQSDTLSFMEIDCR